MAPGKAGPAPSPRKARLFLPPILAAALFVRVLFFSGVTASDPTRYIDFANRLANGTFRFFPHHYVTRLSVLVPVAAFFRLFGVSEAAALIWPALCAFLTFLLVYRIAELLDRPVAGLVAAGLLATLPLDVRLSTDLLPDGVLTALLCVSVWAYLEGTRRDLPRRAPWLLLAGAAIWAAYATKITGIFLLPVYLLHTAFGHRRWRSFLWMAAGAALLLLGESLFYLWRTGDPLFPLHAIGPRHEGTPSVVDAQRHLLYRVALSYPLMTLLPSPEFGVVFLLVWAGFVYGLARPRDRLLLLLWFAVPFLYTNFGSSNLHAYVVLPAVGRYLHPILIPGLLLLGILLEDLWGRRDRDGEGALPRRLRLRRAVAVLVVAGAGVLSLSFDYLGRRASYVERTTAEMREAARFIAARPHGIVYADPRSAEALRLFLGIGGPDSVAVLPRPETGEAPEAWAGRFRPGDLLVVNRREAARSDSYAKLWPGSAAFFEEAVSSGGFQEAARFQREISPFYRRLASFPVLRSAIPADARNEYFGPERASSGSRIYRVD